VIESKLRAFADDAVRQVELPDLDGLAHRGRDLRTRRRTSVVAGVLAVALLGTWLVQDRSPRADDPDPVNPPVRAVDPYPGNDMQDLEAGTYELTPSSVRGEPTALITVPDGWNTWEGPNRFDGHRADDPTSGRYNDVPLEKATWYVGVLVVKVLGVTEDVCASDSSDYTIVDGYAETVRAVSHIPGYRMVEGPVRGQAFGHPATHVVVGPTAAVDRCDAEPAVFLTSANGAFGAEPRTEIWVVDVGGVVLTVIAGSNGDVPSEVQAEQAAVVDSIEFRLAH
jgi:hypothetical protein